jgi:hypothetical protein
LRKIWICALWTRKFGSAQSLSRYVQRAGYRKLVSLRNPAMASFIPKLRCEIDHFRSAQAQRNTKREITEIKLRMHHTRLRNRVGLESQQYKCSGTEHRSIIRLRFVHCGLAPEPSKHIYISSSKRKSLSRPKK